MAEAPARFGPSPVPGGVRFSVWAPGARTLELILSPGPGERRLAMVAGEQGYFELVVPGAGAGLRYLLSRDGGPPVPDPASRFQPDGVFGPSEVIGLGAHLRGAVDWAGLRPDELVIYELHVGTFGPEGTYRGVQDRLDHLAGLGITALELMPLAAFPGRHNWGYDGVFHFAPFAGYGRPEELTALVEACHQRGMAVILDLVTNHFGPEGNAMWSVAPAFFRPDRPTPWSAGHAWELDPVLRYFDEVALAWTRDYRMDGLRLDAFHAVPGAARATHLGRMVRALDDHLARHEPDRRLFVLLESVDNEVSLLRQSTPRVTVAQLCFDLQRAAHALLTGERHGEFVDFGRPDEELGRCVADGFAFRGRYSRHHGRVLGEAEPLPGWDHVVGFLQNHDSCGNRYLGQRLDSLVRGGERGRDLLDAATALLLLHPAIPFLFMGQEWGCEQPFHFFTDFPEELGQSTQRGRERGFREMGPAPWPESAPGCQDPEALARSRLRWDTLEDPPHRRRLQLVRRALAARRDLVAATSRRVTDASVMRDGARYVIKIAGHGGGSGFVLCADLETTGTSPPPADAELLFTTRGPGDDPLAAPSTSLWRHTGSKPR